MERKRILFIVNPISGNRNKKRFSGLATPELAGMNVSYEIVYTEGPGHATQLAAAAVGAVDVVAAVGGDGTLNEVARGLMGSDTPMAIVPAGSGNGLARCLQIPLDTTNAVLLINSGSVERIDTGMVNENPFLSVAGIGLDANTAYDFAADPRRGFLTYARYALRNYAHYHPEEVRITMDEGETLTCHPLLVTFANSNQFGYHAIIAPQASLQDGLLDTCVLTRPSWLRAPFAAAKLMRGRLHKSRYHTDYQAAHIRVERTAPGVVNIDGEPLMMPATLDVRIVPKNLLVVCPEKR